MQSYVDTLSKPAIDRFIEVTHEKYAAEVGGDFGSAVPTIFTDEPQVLYTKPLQSGFADEAMLPWSADFDLTYDKAFGTHICDRLPELFFATPSGENYDTLYNYHKHLTDRFAEAFIDNVGEWCGKHGIDLTGHVIGEDDMLIATQRLGGDVMRVYKNMQLPGIDVLFDDVCLTTAKQCQSAVRQYGKRGMLSELYGVTGWDFDFRGHKFQGDWQACLGVTHRVPHLAWMSMKGEGKRDYPASISYQSPWHEKYSLLECHYARIAAAMSEGDPLCDIAVIHPIESFWLKHTSRAESSAECERLDRRFHSLCDGLLCNGFDFDYISEALLEDLCPTGGFPLEVGKMRYRAIILCDCITLRPHTLAVLEAFKAAGGRLIFIGDTPKLSCGLPSKRAETLCPSRDLAELSLDALSAILAPYRKIALEYDGKPCRDLICTMREEASHRWLFIAHAKKQVENKKNKLTITLDGCFVPTLYDTLGGKKRPLSYCTQNGKTVIWSDVYPLDSLLICLDRSSEGEKWVAEPQSEAQSALECRRKGFSLDEPNSLLLDVARFSIDGGELREREEIMRIDEQIRAELGFASRRTKFVQPWYISSSCEDHSLRLVFTVVCEASLDGTLLAVERPDRLKIHVNGAQIDNTPVGYYVDKDIKTLHMPRLNAGENQIEIEMPFGLRTDLEACYLIGKFGVRVTGASATVTEYPTSLEYGSITDMGLPFYGGSLCYTDELTLNEDCALEIEVSDYFGALVEVELDGKALGQIITPPYTLTTRTLNAGKHNICYKLYGNRHNTFSALHNTAADKPRAYKGPVFWRSRGEEWAYEYQLKPMGILKKPVVRKIKEKK